MIIYFYVKLSIDLGLFNHKLKVRCPSQDSTPNKNPSAESGATGIIERCSGQQVTWELKSTSGTTSPERSYSAKKKATGTTIWSMVSRWLILLMWKHCRLDSAGYGTRMKKTPTGTEDRKKTPTGRKNKKGLLKTVPGFHPAGALRATKFVPDKFVKPTVAMRQWLRSPLLCQIKNPAEAGLCLFGGACSLLRTRLRQDFPVL